jgi:FixJ family two-component response regulator
MIYLIDSNISVARAFELFLESAGMEYRSFKDTESFLAGVKPLAGDLILLDLSMPVTTACELLKKIFHYDLQAPVIVVTVVDDDHFRECCRQYGVKAIMRKPVDGEALIDLIKYSLPA